MKNINVFGYATFGTPNGFMQSCIHGNESLENVLKKFDLKSDAIQLLSPNDRIYSIRKELIQNDIILSYSFYTYAKERNSNRSGTFIGTSLVFTNEILPENLTLKSLHEIHSNLNRNNVDSNNFVLNINDSKDFNLQNIFSKDFEKLEHQTNKVSFLEWDNSGKNLVILTTKFNHNEIQTLYKKSLQILPKYDTIYFIDSKEIAEFVSQKRLFRLIDKNGLDQEIQILQDERKQKRTDAIAKFEKHKIQLEEEKNREIENRKKQIEQNEQKQSENQKKIEESKSDLSKLENLYKTFAGKISALKYSLHSGKNLDEVNNSYKQFEKEFNEEKRKLSSTNHVSSISNPRNTSQISPYLNPYEKPNYGNYEDDEDDEENNFSKILKIVSLVLNIFLIAGIIYLYFINSENEKKLANVENIATSNVGIESNESDPVLVETKLNPIPNDIAKNKIEEIQNKLIDNSTRIDEVVKIVFEINKPVRDIYKYQKGDYEEYLIQENPSAFDSNKVLIKKDSLTKIPFYKDDNMKNESINSTISTK